MTRHIVDHPHQGDPATRAREFMKIERSEKPSKATRELQQASRGARKSRLREFARIERGQTA